MQLFPEIDRAEWFDLPAATMKILEGQRPLLDRLADLERHPRARWDQGEIQGRNENCPENVAARPC